MTQVLPQSKLSARSLKVNIVSLKQMAAERLPIRSALREVLLAESDELTVEEFSTLLPSWLRLLRLIA